MPEISDWLRTRLSRRMVMGAGLAAAGGSAVAAVGSAQEVN